MFTPLRTGAHLTGRLLPGLLLSGIMACHAAPDSHPPAGPDADTTAIWSTAHPVWGPRGRLQTPAIAECSGIVASRRYPDVYWVHNDSGDAPRIFSIDAGGRLLAEVTLTGAEHVDWEDIAIDDASLLYVCDVGNNRSDREDLVVYVIAEPDPYTSASVTIERRLPFRYPDQTTIPDPAGNHDCEAVFWRNDHLYFLSKHRSGNWTRLYRMEDPRATTQQTLTLIDSLEVGSMVTAADLSPDGSQLAVQCYEYLLLIDLEPGDERLLSAGAGRRLLFEGLQSEALAHEGEQLRIINEQGEIHLLERDTVLRGSQFHPAGSRAARPFGREPPHDSTLLRAYRPRRAGITLPAAGTVPLPLRPAPSAGADSTASRAASPPTVTLGTAGNDLRLELSWAAPIGEDEERTVVMILCWGRVGDRPHPEPGDQIYSIRLGPDGLEARCHFSPERATPPTLALERRGERLVGSILLAGIPLTSPTDDTAASPAEDDTAASPAEDGTDATPPGDDAASSTTARETPTALNLILYTADGGEWYWGGDQAMWAPLNPFLWGELRVDP